MQEVTDRTASKKEQADIALKIMSQNIAILTYTVQQQNSVLLAMMGFLKKQGFEVPDWESIEELEKDVSGVVDACIKKVESLNGQRETDKS